jgi:hypothetical protein
MLVKKKKCYVSYRIDEELLKRRDKLFVDFSEELKAAGFSALAQSEYARFGISFMLSNQEAYKVFVKEELKKSG